ncbi:helix-turn-helix transcriptional regulator [Listeria booriae]|uniref:helix-turn-helix transcriptional regulator n=1 Tax=Listeria booriae TaxID=1552123 RepID=UPI001627D1E1|nr:helix-turn-helix transcriptional regulator [Listeria booriae]MBC2369912.1 helix-turn-helix transcriptional regulator [Listeria booriae]
MNTLKKIRTDRGLTQQEAAKKIGISYSLLSKMESGYRGSSDSTKIKIANFYQKSVGEIFFNHEITKSDNEYKKTKSKA